jgi:hypothetical protein
MKRTTKNQTDHSLQQALFANDAEQIKQYHLKKLRVLRDEAEMRSKEWIRKQRLTMLAETTKEK